MSGKRAFPYYTEVHGFELQRRRLEEDPSRWAAAPPPLVRRRRRCFAACPAPRSALIHLPSRCPSAREKDAPRVWQAREQSELDEYDAVTGDAFAAAAAAVGTDFAAWSEGEIRAFLDQRGEDFDDCQDLAALVSPG